jgi:uncharacterized protein (TIGR02145 family)
MIGVQGVCPNGWHVPADQEWKQLELNLGMNPNEVNGTGFRGTDEGAKLKKSNSELWDCPNTVATNETGFSALPGGFCFGDGFCERLGSHAFFWTSSGSYINAWYRSIDCQIESLYRDTEGNKFGFSIRCVKD